MMLLSSLLFLSLLFLLSTTMNASSNKVKLKGKQMVGSNKPVVHVIVDGAGNEPDARVGNRGTTSSQIVGAYLTSMRRWQNDAPQPGEVPSSALTGFDGYL